MNVLATSRGPIPNVINFLGDHGILVIRAAGHYYVCTRTGWSDRLTNRQYIKFMHTAPPCNLNEGYWGITTSETQPSGNWDGARVQAALDMWLDEHRNQFLPNTNNVRPLYFRPRPPQTFEQMKAMIEKATAEVQATKVKQLG